MAVEHDDMARGYLTEVRAGLDGKYQQQNPKAKHPSSLQFSEHHPDDVLPSKNIPPHPPLQCNPWGQPGQGIKIFAFWVGPQ